MGNDEREVWQRTLGEPTVWFGRFVLYRELGVKRSIDKAYALAREAEGLRGLRANSQWHITAERWRWASRAAAWDDAQRKAFLASVETRRVDAQRERLATIERVLGESSAALVIANLSEIDQFSAREMLGSLRMVFFDALKAQRLEYGESTEIVATEHEPFSADEMAAAMAEVEQWRTGRQSEKSG